MLHLFIFTAGEEVSEEARQQIQAAYPRPFGRKPEIIGSRQVEDSLPEEANAFVRDASLQACRDKGLRFNPRRDEIAYNVISPEDGDVSYGVAEIYIARFALTSVFGAAAVAFVVGLALGVTAASVWLLAIGLGGLLVYMQLRGPARNKNEGWFFALGPVSMMSWVAGFIVRGLTF